MKKLSFSEKLLLISTTTVAALALFVSIWQANETRKHNRLSIKPIITFDRSFNSSITINKQTGKRDTTHTFSLTMKNTGIGPAIIKSFDVYHKNKKIESQQSNSPWVMLGDSVLNLIGGTTWLSKGDVVPSGQETQLFQCLRTSETLRLVKLRIHYDSIYEESFVAEAQLEN